MNSDILGWALVALGAIVSVPQVARLLRTRRIEGLSLGAQVLWVASWAGWIIYVTELALWPRLTALVVGLALELVTTALLLAVLTRTIGPAATWARLRPSLPWLALAVTTITAGRALGGSTGMLAALTAVDLIALVPLIRTTVLAPTLTGVSAWSWLLRTTGYLGWIAYAFAVHNPWSAGSVWVMAPAGCFLLTRLAIDRTRTPHTSTVQRPGPPTD